MATVVEKNRHQRGSRLCRHSSNVFTCLDLGPLLSSLGGLACDLRRVYVLDAVLAYVPIPAGYAGSNHHR